VISDAVTTRWATALFNLAKRHGALDDVARDVQRLGSETSAPAVRDWMLAEGRRSSERRTKIEGLLGGFHPLMQNFVRLALDKRREGVLVGLAPAFHERMLDEQGAVEGFVESAHEIPGETVAVLAGALSKKIGKQVRLDSRVVPELIAGVRVFVGARLIDRSVRGRLEGLRSKLYEARLPSASA
jgi:F-type H+-transporting ATPase subunit delta